MEKYVEALQIVNEAKAADHPLIVIRAKMMKVNDTVRLANSDVAFECPEADLAAGMLASAIYGIADETGVPPMTVVDRIREYIEIGMSVL